MSCAALRPPCDEAVIRLGAGGTAPSPAAAGWTLSAAVLGSSMVFIDATVVNVALPAIQVDLGAGAAAAQWVVEAYALTLSALLLAGGALGDRLGRRRVFAAGTALFAIASLACGLAPSPSVLIVSRAVQGVAGALLTPGSLALISSVYGPSRRGRAIGTWSAATAMTTAAGPLAGGLLVEHLSWRWAFLVNLPLAAAVLVMTRTRVPESRDDSLAGGIDWPGATLATAGLGLVVFGLVDSQGAGVGAPRVIAALVSGGLTLAAFAIVETRESAQGRPGSRRTPTTGRQRRPLAPMLDAGLFRSREFAATNGLTFLLYAALGGALFFVPFDLIEVRGFSPAAAGAALIPFVALLSLLSPWSGALADRLGARPPLVAGPLIAGAGLVLFATGADRSGYLSGVLPAVLVLGLGMAITVAPLTATVMGSVDARHAGAASGVNNAVARTAGLLAIAILGIVLTHGFEAALDSRLGQLGLSPPERSAVDAQRSRLALIEPPAGLGPQKSARLRAEVDAAFVEGFRDAMLLSAGLAAAGAAVAAAGLGRRPPPNRAVEATGAAAARPALGDTGLPMVRRSWWNRRRLPS